MDSGKDYEIVCRECEYRRLVSQEDVYRAVKDDSGIGHKLSIAMVEE